MRINSVDTVQSSSGNFRKCQGESCIVENDNQSLTKAGPSVQRVRKKQQVQGCAWHFVETPKMSQGGWETREGRRRCCRRSADEVQHETEPCAWRSQGQGADACDLRHLEGNVPLWGQEPAGWGWWPSAERPPFCRCPTDLTLMISKKSSRRRWAGGPGNRSWGREEGEGLSYLLEELRAVHFYSFANFRWDLIGCQKGPWPAGWGVRHLGLVRG